MRKHPKRCSNTGGLCASPPSPWLSVPLAPSTTDFAAQPHFTHGLHRVGCYSEFQFFSETLPPPAVPGTERGNREQPVPPRPLCRCNHKQTGWGGSHKAWIDLRAHHVPVPAPEGRNRLLDRGCAELKAHFSPLPSPKGSDKRGLFCRRSRELLR